MMCYENRTGRGKRRRVLLALCALLLALASACASAPSPVDAAIQNASVYLRQRLPEGSKIAFINIQSSYPAFSEYVIEGLTEITVNDGRLTVVDRQNLALIQEEMNYQLSGEVDDETARSIGKKLGAQFIITGVFAILGEKHLLRIRAIDVETARIQGQKSFDLPPDSLLAALMAGGAATGAPGAAPPAPAAPGKKLAAALQAAVGEQKKAAPAPAIENYPPELDGRLAELSALAKTQDAAALIEQRNAWADTLAYLESYYQNHLEFAVVYDPAINQGAIDYNRGTVTARVAIQLEPLSGYRKAIAATMSALQKTGKSDAWGLETWPGRISFTGSGSMSYTYFINYEGVFDPQMLGPTTGGTRAEFIDPDVRRRYREQNFINNDSESFGKMVVVRAALVNEQGDVIARGEQRLRFVVAYRETWSTGLGSSRQRPSARLAFAPMAIAEWFKFPRVKAEDLSGKPSFTVIGIDGVPLDSQDSDYVQIRTATIRK